MPKVHLLRVRSQLAAHTSWRSQVRRATLVDQRVLHVTGDFISLRCSEKIKSLRTIYRCV